MEEQNSKIKEIDKVLKEIGNKIEELVKKGAEAGVDVVGEIEKKTQELRANKTTLEEEFKNGKALLEKEFNARKNVVEPKLKESKFFFKEGVKQFGMAIKVLLGEKVN
jgi:low affinity Fe/Cu permease